jgi:hypothetical protein
MSEIIEKIEKEELVAMKVMIPITMARKLKAIGTMHEDEINQSDLKKEAFIIGKGIEITTNSYDMSKLF